MMIRAAGLGRLCQGVRASIATGECQAREVIRAAEELAGSRQTCGMEQADSPVEQLGSTQSGAEQRVH